MIFLEPRGCLDTGIPRERWKRQEHFELQRNMCQDVRLVYGHVDEDCYWTSSHCQHYRPPLVNMCNNGFLALLLQILCVSNRKIILNFRT